MQIVFRNVDSSDAIKMDIENRFEKLNTITDHITSCRVTVEAPHRHHHKGNLYNIKIDVNLPGDVIHATQHTGKHHAHEDVYVAIRDAFEAARRQLKNYVRKHSASLARRSSSHREMNEALLVE